MEYFRIRSVRNIAIAWATGILVEIFAFGCVWIFLINPATQIAENYRIFITIICLLNILISGPLLILDGLTRSIKLSNDGITMVSIINVRAKWTLYWDDISAIDVEYNPKVSSQINKVVITGSPRIGKYGRKPWWFNRIFRRITVTGSIPDINQLLISLHHYAPKKR